MENENPRIDPRLAAFISKEDGQRHVVDTLIRERCPTLVRHWTWPAVRPVLYKMLGYQKALRWADDIIELKTGKECFEYLDRVLSLKVKVSGIDRLPGEGRGVVISNHPTGLADGNAVLAAVRKVREDIEIFANADACRVNPAFADVIIPVEWVEEKRTPAKTRETLKRASATFGAERLLLIFPSGRLANKDKGKIVERGWFPTAVTLARKNKSPIFPLHMGAQNSELFYLLSKVSRELKDITLFHELMNKQGDKFDLTFGPTIPPEHLAGDPQKVTDHLKHYVTETLPNDPDKPFEPLAS